MLAIIEIMLTVSAWKNGWKSRALLPMGIVIGVSFFIGLTVGAAGGTPEAVMGPCLLLDVIGIVVLAVMSSRAPRKERNIQLNCKSEIQSQEA